MGFCNSECDSGYHGDGCMKTCSRHCSDEGNSCHDVSGTCDEGCDPGFEGDLNDQCKQPPLLQGSILSFKKI